VECGTIVGLSVFLQYQLSSVKQECVCGTVPCKAG
jgi:hypothetical protein